MSRSVETRSKNLRGIVETDYPEPLPPPPIEKRKKKSKTAKKKDEMELIDLIQNVMKSSALKKIVYKGGVVKIKKDALDYLQVISLDFLKNVIEELADSLYDETRVKTVSFEMVRSALGKDYNDLEKEDIPNQMAPAYEDKSSSKKAKPGEVTERKIKFFRQTHGDKLIVSQSNFKKLVKKISEQNDLNTKYSKEAIFLLQYVFELYTVKLVEQSYILSKHRKSKTLEKDDIDVTFSMRRKKRRSRPRH